MSTKGRRGRISTEARSARVSDVVEIGAVLLVLMFVLLAAGVWIGMTLAIIGGVGMVWFTTLSDRRHREESLHRVLERERLMGARGVAALHLDGRDPVPHATVRADVQRARARGSTACPGASCTRQFWAAGSSGRCRGPPPRRARRFPRSRCRSFCGAATTSASRSGSLATAGTLGILIPPSITMVVYAVAAEASIIRIFLAGFLPGFLLMLLFSGYIAWWAWRHPELQPPPEAPTTLRREDAPLGPAHPLHAADRVHRDRAHRGLGDGDRVRGVRRARLAHPRLDGRLARPASRSSTA